MRRFLLLTVAMLMTAAGMAIGRGDGLTKANAIEFDWEHGNEQFSGTRWYRVPLDLLYEEDDPTLALYLTNLSDEDVVVTLNATLAGSEETRTYTIPRKQNKIWSVQAGMLIRMKQTEVYLTLQSSNKVALSAKVYETLDIDEACLEAVSLPWNTAVPVMDTTWRKIGMAEAKLAANQDVQIVYTATAPTSVVMATSFDCPSSGLTERRLTLSAGESYTYTLPYAMVSNLVEDEMYLRTIADATVQVKVQLAPKPAVPVIAAAAATEIELGQRYDMAAGQHLYKVRMDDLRQKKMEPLFTFYNEGAERAHLNRKVALELPAYSVIETDFEVAPEEETKVVIEKNVVDGIAAHVEWAYVQLSTDRPVHFVARLKHVHEGDACKTSVDFDWQNGHLQEANTTIWYAIPIADAKARQQDIVVHGQNRGGAVAQVTTTFAFECPYIDLQTMQTRLDVNAQTDKTLSYSSYSVMRSDVVYVGVTSTESIRIWADTLPAQPVADEDMCRDAVALDMTYGARQAAGDTVWYAVPVAPLRSLVKLPYIQFKNMSRYADVVSYAFVQTCPNDKAYEQSSVYILADSVARQNLARDFVMGIASDTIYLRVISSQQTAVSIQFEQENIGSSCNSAMLFNWVSGNDQPAAANLWYMIDLREAKAGNKDVEIMLTNKDAVVGKGVAQLAYSCPCEAPQTQTLSLAAGATRSRVLMHSTLETVDDTLYIRLECSTAIHFEARLIDPAPFDTIPCPDEVVALQWNTMYTQTQDTAWYYLSHDVLSQLGETELTPEVYIHNLSASKAVYVTGEVAYHCPVTAAMMTRSLSVGRSGTVYKLVERSTAEQLKDKDTIMIRLVTTGPVEFKAELVDPNTGDNCAHAYLINTPDTLYQQAGTDKWYKLNVSDARALGGMLVAGVENVGDTVGRVHMDVHVHCDSLPVISRDTLLGAHQVYVRDYASDVFGGQGSPYLYVHIQSEVDLQLWDTLRAYEPVVPLSVCDRAIAIVPNQSYSQQADEAWYSVDMKNLRLNTTGDAQLVLSNDAAAPLDWEVSLGWECDYQHEWTTRQHHIAAQDSVVKTYARSQLHQVGDSVLYLHVRSTQPLRFRLDAQRSRGDDCSKAILFDWRNGNVHPGGEYLWYQVRLDSTLIPDTCDLRLHLDNLNRADSTVANADLYFDCRDAKIAGMTYTMAPDSSKYKDIDRDLLASLGWADMLINYHSDYNTHMWVELVPYKQRGVDYDTIRTYVCDGEEYTDTITGAVYIISSELDFSDPHQWNDTVSWRDGTTMRDSITTYVVKPIVAPSLPESADEVLAIGAMPLLAQGMQLFVDSSEAKLKAYYEALTAPDSVETVVNVYWRTPVGRNGGNLDTVSYLSRTQTTMKLRLFFEGECDSKFYRDITLPIEDYKYVSQVSADTVCPSELYSENTTVVDTLPYQTLIVDTLGRLRQVDTIRTVSTYVLVAPELYTPNELSSNLWPSVKNGLPISYTVNQMRMLRGLFVQDAEEWTMAVDTIVWECMAGGSYTTIDDYTVPVDTTAMTLRYVLTTECGTTLYSEPFAYTLYPCVPNDGQENVSACESYEWHGATYTQSGDYVDTLINAGGCDSVVTLHLIILPSYSVDTTATACSSYLWYGTTYTLSGDYVYSGQTVAGCDSVVTLHLTINALTEDQLPAVAKFGYRLLVIHRNEVEAKGYVFTPEDVIWYRVVGEVDDRSSLDESLWDDIEVCRGDYYTLSTGERLVGDYYAVVTLPAAAEGECPTRLRTVVLTDTSAPMNMPELYPSMVAPGDKVEIRNLDADKVSIIRVYDVQGMLLQEYQTQGSAQFSIPSVPQAGYYMVRVDAAGEQTTLRYMVKG